MLYCWSISSNERWSIHSVLQFVPDSKVSCQPIMHSPNAVTTLKSTDLQSGHQICNQPNVLPDVTKNGCKQLGKKAYLSPGFISTKRSDVPNDNKDCGTKICIGRNLSLACCKFCMKSSQNNGKSKTLDLIVWLLREQHRKRTTKQNELQNKDYICSFNNLWST